MRSGDITCMDIIIYPFAAICQEFVNPGCENNIESIFGQYVFATSSGLYKTIIVKHGMAILKETIAKLTS